MSAMTRLDEIEAREQAATKGPWVTSGSGAGSVWVSRKGIGYLAEPESQPSTIASIGRRALGFFRMRGDGIILKHQRDKDMDREYWRQMEVNADFIAHAREDTPYLLAELREAQGKLGAVEKAARCGQYVWSSYLDRILKGDTDG